MTIPTGSQVIGEYPLGGGDVDPVYKGLLQIFDRDDASVTISTEDRDNFVTNRVTLLAEERLALAVYRPESFVYGDFGLVT